MLGSEIFTTNGPDVEDHWLAGSADNRGSRIVAVQVMTPSDVVRLD